LPHGPGSDPGIRNRGPPGARRASHALAAIPARYALERNAWKEAAALIPRETSFAYADAVTHFARAIGAARSGNPAAARKDVERLAALGDALQKAKDPYWPEQIEIQRRNALAWIALGFRLHLSDRIFLRRSDSALAAARRRRESPQLPRLQRLETGLSRGREPRSGQARPLLISIGSGE
jgi:hypothetical protein